MTNTNTWAVKRLDEISTVTMGQSPPSSSYNDAGQGVPFFQGKPSYIDNLGVASPYQYTTEPTKIVQAGTALMTVRAPVGEIFSTPQDVCIGRGLSGIKANEDVSQSFLNYNLQYATDQFHSLSQGTTFSAINSDDLRGIKVVLPPQSIQQKIADILSSIDEAIQKTDQIIQVTEEMKQGLIIELFNDFQKTKWKVCKLGDVTKFIDYRGKTPTKVQEGIPLITAKNVRMGFIDREPREYIKTDDYDSWMTRGIPKKGDVLFTTEAPLGNIAQIDTDEKLAFAQRVIIMQCTKELNPTFLKYLLMSKQVLAKIKSLSTGGTVKGIKAKILKQVEILVPSPEEQKRIAEIMTECDDKIAKEKVYKNKLIILKRGLMNDIFSQKVQIN